MISVNEHTSMTESIEEARSGGGQARKNMHVKCAVMLLQEWPEQSRTLQL
jgi:hypothetical protein